MQSTLAAPSVSPASRERRGAVSYVAPSPLRRASSILAALLTLTALFAYVNHRTVRLPTTIGVMLIARVASLVLLALQGVGLDVADPARELLGSIDFDEARLQGMLAFLLFAGALHVDLGDGGDQKGVIAPLADGLRQRVSGSES